MKKIIDRVTITPYQSRIFNQYFDNKQFAVFDIETTGLSPAFCQVILSGILLVDGEDGQVIQLFADQPDDEKKILMETARLLADADYIITYNGRHFDVPFMEKRAKHHGLTFDAPYDLDLYQVISGHSPLREVLPSLKQKNVEIYMGLASGRDDEISGKESVELYHRYMATHSLALERKILLHNHDDLIQLYRLLPVIAKTDFHKAMFKMGFPAGNFSIEKISTEGYDLCVAAKQLGQAQDYLSFPTERQPYTLSMSSTDQRAQLRIPCECQAGAIFFDARGILGRADERIEKYPSVVDGYLIVSDHGIINHMEIATFVKVFFDDLSATFPSIF